MPEAKGDRKTSKEASKPHPKNKVSRKNVVQATARTLELTKVGRAVNFKVYRKGLLLGRLAVGLGSIRWSPPGKRPEETKRIPWTVFATMIREWPFGELVGSRLKFLDGYVRWRAPGKRGAGRKMTWDEFVERMNAPLSKSSKSRLAQKTR
ncbi:MAG: hypothetical protein GY856_44855 [bacterium]|nr:hypothetical protein [bacterium]